jgi:hypothetical protein
LLVGAGVALGLPGDLAAGLLSVCGLALAVGVASRLCFDLLPPAPAWVASIAIALSGQTVALGLSGMESLLFAGLVIAGLRDAMVGRRWNGTLFFSLAACVRAEAVLAVLAYFAVLLALRGRQFRLPRPARGLMQVLVVIAAAAIGVLALAALGQGMPSTLAARRWLHGMGEAILPGPEQWTGAIRLLLEDLWLRLSIVQGPGHFVGHQPPEPLPGAALDHGAVGRNGRLACHRATHPLAVLDHPDPRAAARPLSTAGGQLGLLAPALRGTPERRAPRNDTPDHGRRAGR